ncbi:sensor histidine kinase [Lentzea californiensis]|uniref:sensor histidine kinase n=1 Tax=Lentzea californiensis TaxID=438851 RepID=UPI00216694FA|nr:histidine kinase [Lentzea californiensis]MCR3753776.1 Histidine kinase [Lentzea californiensis]
MTRPERPAARPVRRSRTWFVFGAVLVVLIFALLAVGQDGPGSVVAPLVIVALAVATAAWTVIRARRQRIEYEARLTSWAAEHATHHERLRIARELHDIVSHGLGLIIVRATAARRVCGDGREAERDQALADIEHAGRDAVAELRRMLTLLRDGHERDAPLRPVQSLADVPAVVDAARATGLRPSLEITGLGTVSPGVQATACAVVREALANAARYAGPSDVRIRLWCEGDVVVVSVRDDGPAGHWRPARGAGHGLAGLRERVGALGGELTAVPEGSGFHLTARLPDGGRR